MRAKSVIFDMDGVLVDSMRFHVKAWQKTFKPLGVAISAYEVYSREGESWQKSTADFLKMGGYKPAPALVRKVFAERKKIFKKIFKPSLFAGAAGLLKFVKAKGFKLALVTATPRDEVVNMLPAHLVKLFDVMVCGGDTKKGKPHPDPYLKALERLGIKKSQAIVIENAPYGITSCKLAGIKCIAVETSLPKKYLKKADIIVPSLAHVRRYLSR